MTWEGGSQRKTRCTSHLDMSRPSALACCRWPEQKTTVIRNPISLTLRIHTVRRKSPPAVQSCRAQGASAQRSCQRRRWPVLPLTTGIVRIPMQSPQPLSVPPPLRVARPCQASPSRRFWPCLLHCSYQPASIARSGCPPAPAQVHSEART